MENKREVKFDQIPKNVEIRQFTVVNDMLNMCVTMRSNDLWYGFCNDQYCFSMIQKLVADELNIEVGEYYHYAHNLHLYNDKI